MDKLDIGIDELCVRMKELLKKGKNKMRNTRNNKFSWLQANTSTK